MRWLITYSSAQTRSVRCAESWAWQIAGLSWVLVTGLKAAYNPFVYSAFPIRAGELQKSPAATVAEAPLLPILSILSDPRFRLPDSAR